MKRNAGSIGTALVSTALLAVVVAGVGVALTPTHYCAELPTPTGRQMMLVALGVAVVSGTAGLLIALSSRLTLLLAIAALAAGIAVTLIGEVRVGSWGCG